MTRCLCSQISMYLTVLDSYFEFSYYSSWVSSPWWKEHELRHKIGWRIGNTLRNDQVDSNKTAITADRHCTIYVGNWSPRACCLWLDTSRGWVRNQSHIDSGGYSYVCEGIPCQTPCWIRSLNGWNSYEQFRLVYSYSLWRLEITHLYLCLQFQYRRGGWIGVWRNCICSQNDWGWGAELHLIRVHNERGESVEQIGWNLADYILSYWPHQVVHEVEQGREWWGLLDLSRGNGSQRDIPSSQCWTCRVCLEFGIANSIFLKMVCDSL